MDFFDKLGKKASEAYKITADKTGKIAKEAKLRMKISEIKTQINEIYEEIGKKVYENHIREEKVDLNKSLEEECMRIDVLSDEIEDKLKQCLELKDKKQCPNCYKEIDKNMKFCPECGAKQEENIIVKEGEVIDSNIDIKEEEKIDSDKDVKEGKKIDSDTDVKEGEKIDSDIDVKEGEKIDSDKDVKEGEIKDNKTEVKVENENKESEETKQENGSFNYESKIAEEQSNLAKTVEIESNSRDKSR